MPFNLGNHVQETSTVTAGADYDLDGAVSGFLTLAQSGISNGDTFWYAAFQGGNLEVAIGTYVSGTPNVIQRPATPGMSTNGGSLVSWGTDTTVNIVCAQPAEPLKSLMTRTGTSGWGTQITGILARTNTDEYTPYELAASTNISIQNPRGVGGPPTFDTTVDLADLLRRTGGSEAARTMVDRLVLGNANTVITGYASDKHAIYKEDALTNKILEIEDVGGLGTNFIARLMTSGFLRRLLTANASDENDADTVQGQDWAITTYGTPTDTNLYYAATLDLPGNLRVNFAKTDNLNPGASIVTQPFTWEDAFSADGYFCWGAAQQHSPTITPSTHSEGWSLGLGTSSNEGGTGLDTTFYVQSQGLSSQYTVIAIGPRA